MVKSNNFSWMYEKTKGIRNTVSIKVNKYFISFWRKGFRIFHILVPCGGGGSQSHRTLYLVKMNRAYCLCDLYQYEVKKESQSKDLRRGGGIVAKLHYAWSHLAPATLQLSSTTTMYYYFPLERKGFIKDDLSVKIWRSIYLHSYKSLDILFSSNHNIHKSSCGLCFWASDPLIHRFY